MGIPEYEAKRFEGAVKKGGTLLSVHCDSSQEISRAKQVLRDTGARDISATAEEGGEKTREGHHEPAGREPGGSDIGGRRWEDPEDADANIGAFRSQITERRRAS
jgi:hypothetical protein